MCARHLAILDVHAAKGSDAACFPRRLECRRQVKLTLSAVKGQNSVAVDMNHDSIEMMESRCSCTTVCSRATLFSCRANG